MGELGKPKDDDGLLFLQKVHEIPHSINKVWSLTQFNLINAQKIRFLMTKFRVYWFCIVKIDFLFRLGLVELGFNLFELKYDYDTHLTWCLNRWGRKKLALIGCWIKMEIGMFVESGQDPFLGSARIVLQVNLLNANLLSIRVYS